MPSTHPTIPPESETEPAVGKGRTVMVLMIVAALSLVVFFNYLMKVREDARNARPGTLGRIEKSVTLTERSGNEVSISDLQGKVIVAGLLSTKEPQAVGFLKSIQSHFGNDGRLQLLSLAVDPVRENAEVLKRFAEKEGIEGENWWIVTGDKLVIKGFVTRELDLRGVKEDGDKIETYDRRIVLADEKGQIRGFYDIANPDPDLADAARAKFRKELSWVLSQGISIFKTLDKSITLSERSGEAVDTATLNGKIRLVAYVYTRCPNGCAGVVDFMKHVQTEFGEDPRIHLLSFSLDAEHDTPEIMAEWAKSHGVSGDNWWFLTGDGNEINEFMLKGIGFLETQIKPVEDRLSDADIYAHDMRIALIDSENRVRTFYDVMSTNPEQAEMFQGKLMQDVRTLLEEEMQKP